MQTSIVDIFVVAGREVELLERPNGQSPQQVSCSAFFFFFFLCTWGKVYSFHFPSDFLSLGDTDFALVFIP